MSSTVGWRRRRRRVENRSGRPGRRPDPSTGGSSRNARRPGLSPLLASLFAVVLASCSGNGHQFSYTGQAEVDSIVISSQSSGLIDAVNVREGDRIHKGEVLARVNTDRLLAQQKQQEAQLAELGVRHSAARAQIVQAQARLKLAEETLRKTERLLASGGVTRQRRDELATEVEADTANLSALRANERLVTAQANELRAGMELTTLSIRDARITSPIDGVVLSKFHRAGELAGVGTPLFEIANLSVMSVEIYVPLAKLSAVKIGEKAAVSVEGVEAPMPGTVYWISSEAEFTPKTILTQETKTTLVYGVKLHVANPHGTLKIGTPVAVRLG